MANNWKYYQQSGLAGGSANPTHNKMYIDSHNGSDVTGTGSFDNPVKTIQGAIDEATFGFDAIVAGVFEGVGGAGDWTGSKGNLRTFIAEGVVTFEGTGVGSFNSADLGFNRTVYIDGRRVENGTLVFKNYPVSVSPISTGARAYDCEFYNCFLAGGGNQGAAVVSCLFVDGGVSGTMVNSGCPLINCTFINSVANAYLFAGGTYKNNYFDATSKLNIGSNYVGIPILRNNFFEGTLSQKIKYRGAYWDNTELVQAAYPEFGVNDLPSTTVPLLNSLNSKDVTLQETSPLKDAGDNGRQIGYGQVAKAIGASDVAWTTTLVDNTTVVGEAVLSGAPVGTMETAAGIELFPKSRKVTKINLPDFEFNSPLGEMIGNLASDNTPYLLDVEIKYSDDNVNFIPAGANDWLRMAVGMQPFHDTTNDVGTDDPAYETDKAEIIVCRYMKFRITLRDNEQQI
jgi:hypothetical protein